VVVNYANSKPGAEAVVMRIEEKGGKAIAIQGNVSIVQDVQRLFAETKKAYGKLDILVNNAGVYEFAPLEAITPEHIHKQLDLNVAGLIFATQEAVKLMGPEGGSIVNIGSIVGSMPGRRALYTARAKLPWMRFRFRSRTNLARARSV
jgi:3-oxoacyl-[acyl-carrier protein] reductase